jgi:mRNA-degrading endonuclease RelE of RelBE toxin-antitoxin system
VPYRIEYSPECEDLIRAMTARDRAIVLDAVDQQLVHQPTVETRNRKLMRPNPIAAWELRIGDLRVYYDVSDSPDPVVQVLAVGVKVHNIVRIGGSSFPL